MLFYPALSQDALPYWDNQYRGDNLFLSNFDLKIDSTSWNSITNPSLKKTENKLPQKNMALIQISVYSFLSHFSFWSMGPLFFLFFYHLQ